MNNQQLSAQNKIKNECTQYSRSHFAVFDPPVSRAAEDVERAEVVDAEVADEETAALHDLRRGRTGIAFKKGGRRLNHTQAPTVRSPQDHMAGIGGCWWGISHGEKKKTCYEFRSSLTITLKCTTHLLWIGKSNVCKVVSLTFKQSHSVWSIRGEYRYSQQRPSYVSCEKKKI